MQVRVGEDHECKNEGGGKTGNVCGKDRRARIQSQGCLALRRLAPPQYKYSSFREGRESSSRKRCGKVRSRPQGDHADRAEEQRPPR
jgi:hypothetical protein